MSGWTWSRAFLSVLWLAPGAVSLGAGVPGFEIVPITDDLWYKQRPAVNNCGQIVYGSRYNNEYYLEDMYLYENGATTRLTDDVASDRLPDINDAGMMVWMRTTNGEPTAEIVIHDGSNMTLLTEDNCADYAPRVNSSGHVAWSKYTEEGCSASQGDVMFYDGATIQQLTTGWYSDQVNGINDLDEIVWTRYDFCQSPWVSDIQMYSAGQIVTLTAGEEDPQGPDVAFNVLTGLTQAVWHSEHVASGELFTRLWDQGTTAVTIFDPAAGPQINSYGEVAMVAPGQAVHPGWQVWLYRSESGQYIQVTDTVDVNTPRDINDYGEIVMTRGLYPDDDIFFLRRIRNGDVDLDFDVDLDDYFEWSDCWTGPLETDGLCHCRFMDMQHDRDIDMADFAAFQNAFGQPVD